MTDWKANGLCVRDAAVNLWTSDWLSDRYAAIEICIACPVIAACHQQAEKRKEPFGIWASYDREQPHPPGRPQTTPPQCGTPRGFRNHLRHNENPCQPCRDARLAQHKRTIPPAKPKRKRAHQ